MAPMMTFITAMFRNFCKRFQVAGLRKWNRPRLRRSALDTNIFSAAMIESLEPRRMLTVGAAPIEMSSFLAVKQDTPSDATTSGITITDGSGDTSSETVTLSATQGTLAVGGPLSSVSLDISGNGSSNVTITGSVSDINTILGTSSDLQYTSFQKVYPLSSLSSPPIDTLSVSFSNTNTGFGAAASEYVYIAQSNQAPTIAAPPSLTTPSNTKVSVSDLSFSDYDNVGKNDTVTLQATHGTIAVPVVGGDGLVVVGNGSNDVTITGTLANIGHIKWKDVLYSPDTNFVGRDSISVSIDDNGISALGSVFGAPQTTTDSIDVHVTGTVSSVSVDPVTLNYGTALDSTKLTGVASDSNGNSVDGVFTYTSDNGAVLSAGSHTEDVTFTPTDLVDYAVTPTTVSVTVNPAQPTLSVTDNGGIFTGSPYAATVAMTDGNGNTVTSLEGNSPVVTYYPGTSAGSGGTTVAPSTAGTFTAVATFAATSDYASASSSATFTITQAQPTLTVSDASGTYTGSAFTASATLSESTEGSPSLAYYSGTDTSGTGSSSAPTSAGTYTVLASFAGSTDYASTSSSTTFTISQAQPTVTVSDAGGTYTGSAFAASATLSETTEGSPSLTYYSGTGTSGTGSSTAPTSAGTYSVLASFAGSTDYASTSSSTTFTISQAQPTVTVSDAGGTYTGSAFAASATLSESTEGSPSLAYYSGTGTSGTGSSSAPSSAGTYTVLASFAGSTDYAATNSSATFTIAQAQPTVTVSDAGGTYNGSAFPASATLSESTEGSATLTYYSGSSVGSSGSSAAPSAAGTYTVLASFAGSTDYLSTSSSATFTISQATTTVTVTTHGGINSGTTQTLVSPSSFAPTATASVGSLNVSSGGTFSYTYYSGTGTGGTGTTTAPTTIGTYTVVARFTSAQPGSYSSATSSPATYTITDAPNRLAIVSIPSITAGQTTGSIVVLVQDKYSNTVVPDSSISVTLKYPDGHTVSAQDINGVATFSGVQLTTAGLNYFYASGSYNGTALAIASASVTVNTAAASKLVVLNAPTGQIKAGTTENPIQAAVEDQYGNIIAGSAGNIHISYGTAPTTPATPSTVSGKEYFSGIVYNTVGNYTVTLTDTTDGLTPSATYNTSVIPNVPATLALVGTLPAARVNVAVPSFSIAVYDAYGNICTNASATVTLTLPSGTFSGGGTTISVSVLNGYATFTGAKALKFSSTGSFDLVASISTLSGYTKDIGLITVS